MTEIVHSIIDGYNLENYYYFYQCTFINIILLSTFIYTGNRIEIWGLFLKRDLFMSEK